jgi:hypothetical protein
MDEAGPVPGKLEIHAALSALAAGEAEGWIERARTVVRAFAPLQRSAGFSTDIQTVVHRDDAPVTGHSENLGNVTVHAPETREKRWTIGVREDRVGHFKISKVADGLLEFHHFWRADLSTEPREEEHPPHFNLRYDEASLEPLRVDTEETRQVFHWGPLAVLATYAVPLLSMEPRAKPRRTGYQIVIGNRP